MLTLKTAKLHPLVPFAAPHSYHIKQLIPWPMNSSANGVVNYSWLSEATNSSTNGVENYSWLSGAMNLSANDVVNYSWLSKAVYLSREDGAILKTI